MKTIKRNDKLAVAICLACGLNSAQAAINNGGFVGDGNLGNDASGEIFLSVWDQLAGTSYSIDLGTTVDEFIAGSDNSRSWSLDQRFIDWAGATSDPLIFNVAGNNNYSNDWSNTNFGVLATIRTGSSLPNGNISMTSLDGWIGKFEGRANALNISQNNDNGNTDPGFTDFAANLSEVSMSNETTTYFSVPGRWGTTEGMANWVGSATVRGSNPDQTVDFLFIHSPGGQNTSDSTPTLRSRLDGYLTLDVTAATLNWHSNVATVPLPASAWLFLSGLLATLRFHKRKISH